MRLPFNTPFKPMFLKSARSQTYAKQIRDYASLWFAYIHLRSLLHVQNDRLFRAAKERDSLLGQPKSDRGELINERIRLKSQIIQLEERLTKIQNWINRGLFALVCDRPSKGAELDAKEAHETLRMLKEQIRASHDHERALKAVLEELGAF